MVYQNWPYDCGRALRLSAMACVLGIAAHGAVADDERVSNLQAEIAELKAVIAARDLELVRDAGEVTRFKTLSDQLDIRLQEKDRVVTQLEHTVTQQAAEITAVTGELREVRDQKERLDGVLAVRQNEIQRSAAEVKLLETRLDQLRARRSGSSLFAAEFLRHLGKALGLQNNTPNPGLPSSSAPTVTAGASFVPGYVVIAMPHDPQVTVTLCGVPVRNGERYQLVSVPITAWQRRLVIEVAGQPAQVLHIRSGEMTVFDAERQAVKHVTNFSQ